MNPQEMNKGYRRLFWGTFCMVIWSEPMGASTTVVPAVAGMALCYWGLSFLFGQTGSFRFRQARAYCGAGIVIWLFQGYSSSYAFEYGPWSMRFFLCFVEFVIVLQIFANVFFGASELFDRGKCKYYTRCASIFTIGWTICTVGTMAEQFNGGFTINTEDTQLVLFAGAFRLVLGIWAMMMMAKLRQQYRTIGI